MNASARNTLRRRATGLLVGATIIVVPLCVAPTCAFAQPSTDKLSEQGRKVTIDVSVGTESVDLGTIINVERERAAGRLLALSVGARWRLSAVAGISATGWVLRRPSSARFYFPKAHRHTLTVMKSSWRSVPRSMCRRDWPVGCTERSLPGWPSSQPPRTAQRITASPG
jgi:hypothetical protein